MRGDYDDAPETPLPVFIPSEGTVAKLGQHIADAANSGRFDWENEAPYKRNFYSGVALTQINTVGKQLVADVLGHLALNHKAFGLTAPDVDAILDAATRARADAESQGSPFAGLV